MLKTWLQIKKMHNKEVKLEVWNAETEMEYIEWRYYDEHSENTQELYRLESRFVFFLFLQKEDTCIMLCLPASFPLADLEIFIREVHWPRGAPLQSRFSDFLYNPPDFSHKRGLPPPNLTPISETLLSQLWFNKLTCFKLWK